MGGLLPLLDRHQAPDLHSNPSANMGRLPSCPTSAFPNDHPIGRTAHCFARAPGFPYIFAMVSNNYRPVRRQLFWILLAVGQGQERVGGVGLDCEGINFVARVGGKYAVDMHPVWWLERMAGRGGGICDKDQSTEV